MAGGFWGPSRHYFLNVTPLKKTIWQIVSARWIKALYLNI